MPKRFGFPKTERLKSRKQIDFLFAEGKAFSVFPVRVIYRFSAAEKGELKAGVTASKKYFKKAVDRNRIKCLLREAYRLQKEELTHAVREKSIGCDLFFIYTDKTIADFETVKTTIAKCLQRLQKMLPVENPS